MASLTPDIVQAALAKVSYPGFSRDIVSFGLVKDVAVEGDTIRVVIEHSIADGGVLERIRRDTQAALGELGAGNIDLQIRQKGQGSAPAGGGHAGHSHGPQPGQAPGPQGLHGVRKIVAVASGKGGVGKSTVATNLAYALSKQGKRVGLLDADIYGPSIPTMMGIDERPEITEDKKIHPIVKDGVQMISIGFLVPAEKAMIWRGPMVMGAVQQFLGDCLWDNLDVLVVDLPPGTGDAQLTLVQRVPIDGVVMVTTPQEVALIDVVRGIQMFQETRAPIIGVVENMSGFLCPCCGEESDIFGKGGGIRACGDDGRPVVVAHPESKPAQVFVDVADSVTRFLEATREATA
jgi:ATP-binding protein involved in chromosome partitioning